MRERERERERGTPCQTALSLLSPNRPRYRVLLPHAVGGTRPGGGVAASAVESTFAILRSDSEPMRLLVSSRYALPDGAAAGEGCSLYPAQQALVFSCGCEPHAGCSMCCAGGAR